MKRCILLLLLAGCLATEDLRIELPADTRAVLVQVNETAFYAISRESFDRTGIAFSLLDEQVLLRSYPYSLQELVLKEGKVDPDGVSPPLPRPSAAHRVVLEDEPKLEPLLEVPYDDLSFPLARWDGCFAEGRCSRELAEDPRHHICVECEVDPPEPPIPPLPPQPPQVDLAVGCLGPTENAGSVQVCGFSQPMQCMGDEADFLDAEPICVPVGTACSAPWPSLPPDTIYVDAQLTLDEALAQVDAHPSRTLALEPGTHQASSPLIDVRVIGRCTGATLSATGGLHDARLENLTLDAEGSAFFSLTAGVLRSFSAQTASVTISRSLIRTKLDLAGSLTVRESVLEATGFDWGIEMHSGALVLEDVRIDVGLRLDRAHARMTRVSSRGAVHASDSRVTIDRFALSGVTAAALEVVNGSLIAQGVSIAGGPGGIVLRDSTASIERFVFRGNSPQSVALATEGSTLTLSGALVDGTYDDAFWLGSSTATITDAYVTLETEAEEDTARAFTAFNGSALTVQRARIDATFPVGLCLDAGDRARVRVMDLDCSTLSPSTGIRMGDVFMDMERVRLTGFKYGVYEERTRIRAVDLDVVCGAGVMDEQSGALHLLDGAFQGQRIRVSNCRWNGITARFFTRESFQIDDLIVEDCDSGMAVKNGGVTLRKVEIARAQRRGIAMNGSFELGLASGTISDLRIVESSPNAIAGIEGLEIEYLSLDRFEVERGQAGLSLGDVRPITSNGVIRGTSVGFVVLAPLDAQLLELTEDVQMIGVADPIDLHLPR